MGAAYTKLTRVLAKVATKNFYNLQDWQMEAVIRTQVRNCGGKLNHFVLNKNRGLLETITIMVLLTENGYDQHHMIVMTPTP